MKNRIRITQVAAVGLLAGLIMTFQNCAPVGRNIASDNPAQAEEFGFSEKTAALAFEDLNEQAGFAPVTGSCSDDKPLLGFSIKSKDGKEVVSGLTECENSRFTIKLSKQMGLKCGGTYDLEISSGSTASSNIETHLACSLGRAPSSTSSDGDSSTGEGLQ